MWSISASVDKLNLFPDSGVDGYGPVHCLMQSSQKEVKFHLKLLFENHFVPAMKHCWREVLLNTCTHAFQNVPFKITPKHAGLTDCQCGAPLPQSTLIYFRFSCGGLQWNSLNPDVQLRYTLSQRPSSCFLLLQGQPHTLGCSPWSPNTLSPKKEYGKQPRERGLWGHEVSGLDQYPWEKY